MISIAKAVIEKIVCRYGLFDTMVSDRGSVFVGSLAAHIYKALRIHRVKTTAYHPQSNGIIERFHETLKMTLKLWSHEVSDEWDDLLPFAIFAYNTAFHTGLQEVPFYLNHGYDAKLPIDAVLGTPSDNYGDVHWYAAELVDKLKHVHARVKEILQEVNQQRDESALMAKILNLKVGDEVFLYDPSNKKGESSKLKKRWLGPYKVLERKSPTVYVINKDGHADSVAVERLKKRETTAEPTVSGYDSQLEQLESELLKIKELQQNLLQRQQLKEVQKEQLAAQKMEAAAVAASAANDDSHGDDNDDVIALSAIMVEHLHSLSLKWR